MVMVRVRVRVSIRPTIMIFLRMYGWNDAPQIVRLGVKPTRIILKLTKFYAHA